ncbi:glycerophosphodiester phosphodiesterase family protein [Paenibacillus tarimensis]
MRKNKIAVLLIWSLLSGLFLNTGAVGAAGETADQDRISLSIDKTLTAPIIDGRTDEPMWTVTEPMTVPFGTGTFKPSAFGMLWDYTYLYIAVNIEDDSLVHDGSGYWFEQDNIGLFFDPTLHRSEPFDDRDMQMGLVYQPNTTTPAFYFGAAPNHAGKDEKKVLRAIRTTDNGWTAEIAVPWTMLGFDPVKQNQLGMQIGVTDRDAKDSPGTSSMWSNYGGVNTFWNDTSGYGTVLLNEENPVGGQVSNVLLEENFDGYATGETPFGWISDVNSGSQPMTVVQSTYGNGGMLVFDGNAAGMQSRISAPVQWDNYTVEADVTFHTALNDSRWAALMFRVPANGKNPYNQMAVRQNGAYEIAYRTPDNNWSVPVKGIWGKPLVTDSVYSLKMRVFDNNVKEYIKGAADPDYTLLTDKNLNADLLERGKIGFQADQSKVSFDNLKVTRITAERLEMKNVPETLEALTGPVQASFIASFSDGITDPVSADRVKLYSSDESVIRIMNNSIVPLKAGQAQVKAVYYNATAEHMITVTPSATEPKVVELSHEKGYLLTNAGEPIDLAGLTFETELNDLTTGTVQGDLLTWTASDGGVIINESKLTSVERAGIFKVTAQKDSTSVDMIVVAKNPSDTEYVLYEENFNTISAGTLPQGWNRIEGTTPANASVQNGAFLLDARTSPDNPSRVLLPDYLGLFGDYRIEADVTHASANETSRWHSIMYRVQNNNYPYYQMAVRQGATAANGVEFAERTPANAWNVVEKAAYTEAIDAGQMYHYTVIAHGNRVQQSVNGTALIDTDVATAYPSGKIGLQANGSQMKVDNLKVFLQEKPLPPLPSDRFVNVKEPQTSIALAPTVAATVRSEEELVKLTGDALPATVILHVNEQLDVIDPSGERKIGSLASVMDTIGTRMIPAFYVKDEISVDRLIAWMKERQLEDAFVVSDSGDLVKKARQAYPILRGIVDFQTTGELTKDGMMDIRRTTNASLAKIALLPADAASRTNVEYLQERLITVWSKTDEGVAGSVDMHKLITAGVNGIVTDKPDAALQALGTYANNTTLIRKPLIIGHRGIPALAPENTLEGAILAYEKGADIIESDIYLSKDGHLVIMHDPTLDRTTNGTGNVENFTLAELKALKANDQFPGEYPDARIPTLAEFFDTFKGVDVLHFVEIKSYKPETVDALVKLIEEKGVEDQVVVISFNDKQLKYLGEKMPGMSLGYLTGGYANETNIGRSLRNTLQVIQPLNATFNTSYPGLGENFMEASKHRGITVWPWTYRDRNIFVQYFQLGTYGLTTDYSHWVSDWAAGIAPKQAKVELTIGKSSDLTAVIETYKGDKKEITPHIIVLDGQDLIKVNGNRVTAVRQGKANVLLRYTVATDAGNTYDLYTQPVMLKIKPKHR